ncbi:MAG: prephenate dehydratase [candidate division Zixibacteria bacterium]|nr:prephenate dehydratase [candidate division Zixibacteria bacterium]MDH3937181.1 prephenate dehydratase [candidate division Zixibacteria bacterium]MDH4032444.1 prephenate dehydratase [candidate division Zixibacteria bacterium]
MAVKKVAFQGERGAFSEQAARQLAGSSARVIPCDSFDTLFDRVESGKATAGVIPIENSLIGSIHRNYDLLLERDLHVIDETQVRVLHCLIAPPGVTVRRVKKVFSHPAALDQCRRFFTKHPGLSAEPFYDTAGAVKMLSEETPPNAAAIASPLAAEIYGMKVLRKSIEDEKFNFTRFLLLSKKMRPVRGVAKTSVVFSLKNEPGNLYRALSVFALRDIDLRKIESRPSRRKAWQYYFYVDFIGSLDEDRVKYALANLDEITHFVRILGCYPARVNG